MNVLILEDEIYNYHLLCTMLADMLPDCTIHGPIVSIKDGKRFFSKSKESIDLIIADIQLTDGLSFHALEDAPADVPIIFTTAYDEYALRAFEYNSLSYLLKPIDENELKKAIRKASERLITDDKRKEFFSLIAESGRYRERIMVNTFKGEKVVGVGEVRYIVSENKNTYIVLHDGTSYYIDMTLTLIADQLNPRKFMRVNRKYIVPLTEVEGFERDINGKERLILKEGVKNPVIVISRDNKRNVHNWIDGMHTPQ